jgi:hypothetical protein
MKRVVDIYVEGISGSGNYSKLELFNDEKIELTSSIQNIQDISKVYTDFTQSFTIPASPINNAILHHFYQSDVDVATTNGVYQWNFNFRIRAKIEVGLTPFRTGTIMVEKSEIKNGRPDNYTITFYGDLVTLKDKFGDAKLSDLDLSAYDIEYSGPNVISKISTNADSDLMFPLISSQRVWTYNDSTSTDITKIDNAIKYTELFPALKVRRILEAIGSKFALTFNSSFFTSTNDRWDKLYMLLKNEEQYTPISKGIRLNITAPDGFLEFNNNPTTPIPGDPLAFIDSYFIDIVNDTITPSALTFSFSYLYLSIYNVSSTNVFYYVDIYTDDVLTNTLKYKGNVSNIICNQFEKIDIGKKTSIYIRTESTLTYSTSLNIYYPSIDWSKPIKVQSPITSSNFTDIHSKLPEITISDFFSGILKMFNSTCYATDTNTFTLEPIDNWYSKGAIYDITEFTDTDSIVVERQNIYKKLSFKYQKSESFMNRRYYDNNQYNKEYSDTFLKLSNEGNDFDVQLPFENLLMNSFDLSRFDVGYCLTKFPDYKPYIPKPVLLYKEGYRTANVYLNNGTTSTQYSQVNIFNSHITIDNVRYTLNFHPEIDTQTPNDSITNTLYQVYYSGYLSNLFNPKSRLIRVKAHFPLSLITKLKLNDRLIIRDKRYIINELKTDITNGEVELSLLNDFRPMVNNAILSTIVTPPTGGTVTYKWELANGVDSVDFSSPIGGVSFSPSTITTDTEVDITIPTNTNTPTPIVTESGTDTWLTDDGWNIINEEGAGVTIPIYATNNNFDGTTTTYDFYLNQE